jgi:hypothetical protein
MENKETGSKKAAPDRGKTLGTGKIRGDFSADNGRLNRLNLKGKLKTWYHDRYHIVTTMVSRRYHLVTTMWPHGDTKEGGGKMGTMIGSKMETAVGRQGAGFSFWPPAASVAPTRLGDKSVAPTRFILVRMAARRFYSSSENSGAAAGYRERRQG